VNCLLKVRNGGSDINSQAYTVYQRTFQKRFSQFTTTASSGGVDTIPLSISADPLLTVASATMDTWSDMSITWGAVNKDAGDGDGAQPYSVVIATTDSSRTLVEIYNWVQYQLTKATDIDDGAGTHVGKITDQLVDMSSSTSMVTRTGVWVEGFLDSDINNIIFTDDNSVTHDPPLEVSVAVTIDASVVGAQVAVFELDAPGYTDATYTPAHISSTIINATSASTVESTTLTYSADVPVRVIVRYPGYQQFSLYTTITSGGLSVTALTPSDNAY
jgi:hypothetical protein